MRIHELPATDEPSYPTGTYRAIDGFFRANVDVQSTPDRFANDTYQRALANMAEFLTGTEDKTGGYKYDIDDDVRQASLENFQRVTGGLLLESAGVEVEPPLAEQAGAMAMAGSEIYISMPTSDALGQMASEAAMGHEDEYTQVA